MPTYYCIRHLPTLWNMEGRLQGSKDIPILKELNEDTNSKIIENNKKLPINATVLTSEYIRTQQTAIQYSFNDFNIEPLLNEFNFGDFEGKLKKDFLEKKGKQWLENPKSLVLGESVLSLEQRVNEFISKYKHNNEIILFGHGAFIRGFISIVNHNSINKMNQIHIKNNELNIIEC